MELLIKLPEELDIFLFLSNLHAFLCVQGTHCAFYFAKNASKEQKEKILLKESFYVEAVNFGCMMKAN